MSPPSRIYSIWRPRDAHRELYFLQHTLSINDFCARAILAAQKRGLSLDWTDERTLRRREMRDYVADPKHPGQRLAIVPDGYFTLSGAFGNAAFAIELDRATVEEKPFKAKARAYGEWKTTGAYVARYGSSSLRVLFVLGSASRDRYMVSRMKRWCESQGGRSLFWFADLKDIAANTILTAPIWQGAGRHSTNSLLEIL